MFGKLGKGRDRASTRASCRTCGSTSARSSATAAPPSSAVRACASWNSTARREIGVIVSDERIVKKMRDVVRGGLGADAGGEAGRAARPQKRKEKEKEKEKERKARKLLPARDARRCRRPCPCREIALNHISSPLISAIRSLILIVACRGQPGPVVDVALPQLPARSARRSRRSPSAAWCARRSDRGR